jgi:Family of unknown function (DUF6489)
MKINLDVDCTPEEARRFLGLPDLSSLHDVYLKRAEEAMSKGFTPDMMDQMVKSWAPMGAAGLDLVQKMVGGLSGKGKTS